MTTVTMTQVPTERVSCIYDPANSLQAAANQSLVGFSVAIVQATLDGASVYEVDVKTHDDADWVTNIATLNSTTPYYIPAHPWNFLQVRRTSGAGNDLVHVQSASG